MENIKTTRNNAIEFWRFAFAILIVLCHMPVFCPSFFHGNIVWFKSSSIGVEFFFILSGFLMAKSALKYNKYPTGKATWKFIFGKWCGVIPVYLFAYGISLVIKYLLNYGSIFELFSGSIFEFFFLQMSGLAPLFNNHEYMVRGTWYISAMLLMMYVLFPLLQKNRDIFLNILAPLLVVFILGYFCTEHGSLKFENNLGLLRAMAEICIGCISYSVVEKIIEWGGETTKFASFLLTLIEFGCLGTVLVGSWFIPRGEWDFIAVFLLAIGIVISFSGLSFSNKLFNAKIFPWLGKLSLAIYLNHVIWMILLQNLNMPLPLWLDIAIVFALTLTSSCVCVFFIDFVKELWKVHGKKVKRLFVIEKEA